MNTMNKHDQLLALTGRSLAENFGEALHGNEEFTAVLMDAAAAYVEAQGIFSEDAVIFIAAELVARVTVLVD
jgi:hypothetical protein